MSERATAIAHAFSEHGLETVPSPYIRHDIWKKLLVNVGISAMSGITNLTIGAATAIPELRRMVLRRGGRGGTGGAGRRRADEP